MALNNPYAQYKQNSVMTASPQELTLMLYEGAIRFVNQSKIFVQEKKLDKANSSNLRAQNIISELNITLNMNYPVSQNLRSIYNYLLRRLVEANLRKDTTILDEVLEHLTELRNTWKEAIKLARKSR